MKETIVTELESVEFAIWDIDSEEWLTDADEINDFIDSNTARKVAAALSESMQTMLADLKERIGKDLVDLYRRCER